MRTIDPHGRAGPPVGDRGTGSGRRRDGRGLPHVHTAVRRRRHPTRRSRRDPSCRDPVARARHGPVRTCSIWTPTRSSAGSSAIRGSSEATRDHVAPGSHHDRDRPADPRWRWWGRPADARGRGRRGDRDRGIRPPISRRSEPPTVPSPGRSTCESAAATAERSGRRAPRRERGGDRRRRRHGAGAAPGRVHGAVRRDDRSSMRRRHPWPLSSHGCGRRGLDRVRRRERSGEPHREARTGRARGPDPLIRHDPKRSGRIRSGLSRESAGERPATGCPNFLTDLRFPSRVATST